MILDWKRCKTFYSLQYKKLLNQVAIWLWSSIVKITVFKILELPIVVQMFIMLLLLKSLSGFFCIEQVRQTNLQKWNMDDCILTKSFKKMAALQLSFNSYNDLTVLTSIFSQGCIFWPGGLFFPPSSFKSAYFLPQNFCFAPPPLGVQKMPPCPP